MQKNKKKHSADLEKNASQTDGQTDRWRDEQDLYLGPLPQRWRFDHVFQKLENKILFNYLA